MYKKGIPIYANIIKQKYRGLDLIFDWNIF